MMIATACVSSVLASGAQAPVDLRVNRIPPAGPGAALPAIASGAPLRFSWIPRHSGVDQTQTAYRLRLRTVGAANDATIDTGVVQSAEAAAEYSGAALPPMRQVEWQVQWFDAQNVASAWSEPARFFVGPAEGVTSFTPAGAKQVQEVWIGGGGLLRKEFTVSAVPPAAHVVVAGIGYFHLFVNGQKVGAEPLSGAWVTWNKRVLYWTFDVTQLLKPGANAIGVMLGHGWRDTSEFPPHPGVPCDANERLLRLGVFDGSGNPLVATDATWSASDNGPVVSDHVYDGEAYDARKEQAGWAQPGFQPPAGGGWTAATVVTCFGPQLSPLAFPAIQVDVENKPVKINGQFGTCLGGTAGENTVLTITCKPGTGSITAITFASFGTPSGGCPSFQKGSCDSSKTLQIVEQLCVGKTSCSVNASDTVFGDPCFGTVKSLAVAASGCEPQSDGKYVVDFGENLSGVVRLKVKGAAGTTVTLRHAEVLQHPPYGPVDGNIYVGNLRSAKATDTYTLRGDPNGETYQPFFTYHGFQYVEVTGYPGQLTADDITQVHFHTAVPVRTKFHSSSPVLNAIQDHALRGQGSNLMSVPTDCDQRDERLGWMGDSSLSADSIALNYDAEAFLTNWIRNVVDAQDPDGSLPDVVPFERYGGRPADVSWSQALPQNLWVMLKQYGNTAVNQQYWPALVLYLSNLAAQYKQAGSFKSWHTPYGDWVPAGGGASPQFCTAFSYVSAVTQAAEIARALNKTAEQQQYAQLAQQLAQQVNREFYNAQRQCWDNCQQSSYGMAQQLGVVTADIRANFTSTLVNDIVQQHATHVTVGIIGAKNLFPSLTALNQQSLATTLAEQTSQPSWGYMIFNDVEPATASVWELWNSPTQGPGMNSRNHHMFSSLSHWIVTSVGGVDSANPCPTAADDARPVKVTLAPVDDISRASVRVSTGCGDLAVQYQRTGGLQCLRLPEGRSASRPMAPVVPDAVLDCGVGGGVIEAVTFASWGNPSGACGGFSIDPDCHENSIGEKLERLCVGKQTCNVPASADFWGADLKCHHARTFRTVSQCSRTGTCQDEEVLADSLHKLYAEVRCSKPHGVVAEVEVPVGAAAHVHLPLNGLRQENVKLTVNGAAILDHGRLFQTTAGVRTAVCNSVEGSAAVVLGSGKHAVELMAQ